MIREGTHRAKKEALSKVLERIECYFTTREGRKWKGKPVIQYHLAKVKFIPVALVYRPTDSKAEIEQKAKVGKGLVAMSGAERMGYRLRRKAITLYAVKA